VTETSALLSSSEPWGGLPRISIVVPTLNSASHLERCLASIASQDYPMDRVEVIVADGGSTDATIAVALHYSARVILNSLKTGEAGKSVGLRAATGDIVAFIDSDNILPQFDWLKRMVDPFRDANIMGSEPIAFHYDRSDAAITRYCAMLGMNDPICLFTGNYDRFSEITQRWTDININVVEHLGYTEVLLQQPNLPTIGANGTMFRRGILEPFFAQDYFFDIDVVAELASGSPLHFAKTHIGITHIFTTTWYGFARKQHRRVTDYFYYSRQTQRKYDWGKFSAWRLAWFVFAAMTIVPTLVQGLVGYSRKPDPASLCHPVACFITLAVYATATVRNVILGTLNPANRVEWRS